MVSMCSLLIKNLSQVCDDQERENVVFSWYLARLVLCENMQFVVECRDNWGLSQSLGSSPLVWPPPPLHRPQIEMRSELYIQLTIIFYKYELILKNDRTLQLRAVSPSEMIWWRFCLTGYELTRNLEHQVIKLYSLFWVGAMGWLSMDWWRCLVDYDQTESLNVGTWSLLHYSL